MTDSRNVATSYDRRGLVRFSYEGRPVGAGFVVDDRYILTCAHVINSALNRVVSDSSRPQGNLAVHVRAFGRWAPVEVTLVEWIPRDDNDSTGDIAVLEMVGQVPDGLEPAPLHWLFRHEYRFNAQGFYERELVGASGVIRAGLALGEEGIQLEDIKSEGRPVSHGFSGTPIWDIDGGAVVGMAVAAFAPVPDEKIAAMIPVNLLAKKCPNVVPSRVGLDPDFRKFWVPRARGETSLGSFFTGRHTALRELVSWITNVPSPSDNLRLVMGGPGSGKSVVLAQFVTRSDRVFCRRNPLASDSPLQGFTAGTIDAAVVAHDRTSKEILGRLAESLNSDNEEPQALADDVNRCKEPVTFIVDGLDEAIQPQEVVAALVQLAGAARNLRLLVGTRSKFRSQFDSAAEENAMDLDVSKYANLADLQDYVVRQLLFQSPALAANPYLANVELANLVAGRVAERAYPSFLIAQMTARRLIKSGVVIDVHREGWDQFATSIRDAMQELLTMFKEDRRRVEDLLRPLAYIFGEGLVPGPLWVELANGLSKNAESRYSAGDLDWLVSNAADYLVEGSWAPYGKGKKVYRLYHQALVDYVREQDRKEDIAGPEKVLDLLLSSQPKLLGSQTKDALAQVDWSRVDSYVRAHLADHAAAVGTLAKLVAQPGYLVVADPGSLSEHLEMHPEIDTAGARVYRVAAGFLTGRDNRYSDDRASRILQLQLYANRLGERRLERKFATLATELTPRLLWTQETRRELGSDSGHEGGVWMLALGERNGTPVVVSGSSDLTVRVWDLVTGDAIYDPMLGHFGEVSAVAVINRKGQPTVVSGSEDMTLRLWDLATGEAIGDPMLGHTGAILDIAVCERNGVPIAVTASADKTLRVWDLAEGKQIGDPLEGHDGEVWTVELLNPTTAVSGGIDSTVRVWDLSSGTSASILEHPGGVWTLALAEIDGENIVVTGGLDTTVRSWNLATGRPYGSPLRGHVFGAWSLAVTELNGSTIVVTGGSSMKLRAWDLVSGTEIHEPLVHTGEIWNLKVGELNDHPVVVYAGSEPNFRVWDLVTDQRFGRLPTSNLVGMWRVVITNVDDQAVAVSGGTDGTLRIWDMTTGDSVGNPLAGHDGPICEVAATHLGGRTIIVSAGVDDTVRVWDLSDGRQLRSVSGPHGEVVITVSVAEFDGQPILITGGADGSLDVWDLSTGVAVGAAFAGHPSGVQSIATGRLSGKPVVVSAGLDATIRIWDLATRKPIGLPLQGHAGAVRSLALADTEDGPILVSGSTDSTLRVWDPVTGRQRGGPLTGHIGGIQSVGLIVDDDRELIVSGAGSTVRIWDLDTRTEQQAIRFNGAIISLAASSEGHLVICHEAGLTAIQL